MAGLGHAAVGGVERGSTDFLLNFQRSNRKVELTLLVSVNSGTLNRINGEGRTHSILRSS